MADKVLKEQGKYPVVEAGLYEAEVLEINEDQNKFYPTYDDGQPRIDVTFKFVIQEGDFEDSYVWGRTTPTFTTNPDCKLRRWVQEILGVDDLPLGYELDYPDLVGRKVRVWVKHSANGKARVDEVLKSLTGGAKSASPSPAAVAASASAPAIDDFGEEPF